MEQELWQWFFIAAVVALSIVVLQRRRFNATPPERLSPTLTVSLPTHDPDATLALLKTTLPSHRYRIYHQKKEEKLLIVESPSIGLFHWGFLYFISPNKEGLNVGIFGKGPNPPNKKALQKHLDAFCLLLKEVMQTTA